MKAFTCEQNEEKTAHYDWGTGTGMWSFAAGSTHPLPHRRAIEFSTATAVKGFVKNETKLKCSEGGETI